MYKLVCKAVKVNNSRHYIMNGFTVPLLCPAAIYEIYTKSMYPYLQFIGEELNDNASPVHRGDFYRLVAEKLKSRSADLYKFSLLPPLHAYFNKFLPVTVNTDSTIILAFAGDGTNRAWVYIENYTIK